MKENGYINATKMCEYISEQTGSKKPFCNWTSNASAKELTNAVSSEVGILASELVNVISTGSKNLTVVRGTYVHPLLITHIAMWVKFVYFREINKSLVF